MEAVGGIAYWRKMVVVAAKDSLVNFLRRVRYTLYGVSWRVYVNPENLSVSMSATF